MNNGTIPFHFLRIGSHAEKEYFLNAHENFEGIFINANLIEATTAASASLISNLKNIHNKPFFIDPFTFAFGLKPQLLYVEKKDRKKGTTKIELKSTYANLSKQYGTVIQDKVNAKTSIQPKDFEKPNTKEELCHKVLEYQLTKLSKVFMEDDFFSEEGSIEPIGLIAPYFFIPEIGSWLDLNIDLAKTARQVNNSKPLYAIVCFDPRILQNDNDITELIKKFKQLDVEGYLLWVSGLDEKEFGMNSLKNFIRIITNLNQNNRKVINMYGGYLSILLSKIGLSGFSHGVGYGAEKDVEPVIGGVPSVKFYFPPLHERFLFADIKFVLAQMNTTPEKYKEQICNCDICNMTIQNNIDNFDKFGETKPSPNAKPNSRFADREYATGDSVRLNRIHFLKARHKEIQIVKNTDLKKLLMELEATNNKYKTYFGYNEHFKIWSEVLLEQS